MYYKDITLDSGLSRLKWQFPSPGKVITLSRPLPGGSYLHQITKKASIVQWIDYFNLRRASSDYQPWLAISCFKDGLSELLSDGKSKKIAVIHIRTHLSNATAEPTNPLTYLDALSYLSDLGYAIVFAGREKIPQVFQKYNLINYANSPLTSFKHDLKLIHYADIIFAAGSGFAYLPDILDKPYIYLNSWHLGMLMPSRWCICVPTLVRRKEGGFLRFSEQSALFSEASDVGHELFPQEFYSARNASADEILQAVKELLALKDKWTEPTILQEQFRRTIGPENNVTFWGQSRISENFLQRHQDLF
jgi:putative glycosyltransferase (TIGR04372 family)